MGGNYYEREGISLTNLISHQYWLNNNIDGFNLTCFEPSIKLDVQLLNTDKGMGVKQYQNIELHLSVGKM